MQRHVTVCVCLCNSLCIHPAQVSILQHVLTTHDPFRDRGSPLGIAVGTPNNGGQLGREHSFIESPPFDASAGGNLSFDTCTFVMITRVEVEIFNISITLFETFFDQFDSLRFHRRSHASKHTTSDICNEGSIYDVEYLDVDFYGNETWYNLIPPNDAQWGSQDGNTHARASTIVPCTCFALA